MSISSSLLDFFDGAAFFFLGVIPVDEFIYHLKINVGTLVTLITVLNVRSAGRFDVVLIPINQLFLVRNMTNSSDSALFCVVMLGCVLRSLRKQSER